jgi:aspartyl-tRNA synthetase
MWAIKRDWTEIMEFSEKFIISMTHALQNCERYSTLTKAARRIYPRAGDFKLGLDDKGRMVRLKFSEAKQILRDVLGRQTDDLVDIT